MLMNNDLHKCHDKMGSFFSLTWMALDPRKHHVGIDPNFLINIFGCFHPYVQNGKHDQNVQYKNAFHHHW